LFMATVIFLAEGFDGARQALDQPAGWGKR
jgi:hypothetical protein